MESQYVRLCGLLSYVFKFRDFYGTWVREEVFTFPHYAMAGTLIYNEDA